MVLLLEPLPGSASVVIIPLLRFLVPRMHGQGLNYHETVRP